MSIHGFPCGAIATNFISYDLTADLTEVNATTAVVDMENYATLDIVTDVNAADTNTRYQLVSCNHLFGSSGNT